MGKMMLKHFMEHRTGENSRSRFTTDQAMTGSDAIMRDDKRPFLEVLVIGPAGVTRYSAIYITSYNCPPQLSPLYDAPTYPHSIFMLTRRRIPHSAGILKWL